MGKNFCAFRYLITKSDQINLFASATEKEELVKEVLRNLEKFKKTNWSNNNVRYLLIGIENYKDELFFLKFAKESSNTLYLETELDIAKKDIIEAKYVYIIVNTTHQIVLIEDNKSLFQKIDKVANLLAKYINDNMADNSYYLNVYPLVKEHSFWSQVDDADSIYNLTLELNSPNMTFFANRNAQELLGIIQDETNNEELDIVLKNSKGKLDIKKNSIGEWIDYIREVGGKYILKYKSDGDKTMKTLRSTDEIYKTRFKLNDDYIDVETKESILEKTSSINDLEKRI